jgi:hypothetical protein
MSDLINGSGPLFLFAEIEYYSPAATPATPQFQAMGVLPIGVLEQSSPVVSDSAALLVSDTGYVTRETDAGGLRVFAPLLISTGDIDRQIDIAPGGQGAGAGWGSLNFVNNGTTGTLALTSNADGRPVRVRIGRKTPLTVSAV